MSRQPVGRSATRPRRRVVHPWILVLSLMLSPAAAPVCRADEPAAPEGAPQHASLLERETLTDNWFGPGETLTDKGIEIGLGLTHLYQFNTHGGMATHRHAGRWAGSYDLELSVDFEALAGLKGLSAYALAEGSWSEGLDASSVGSLFGVNGDAGGDRSIDVTQLWFEQALMDGRLRVRLGKLDLGGGFECRGCPVSFDGNQFANDETSQFLNGALVNNPTIPFPDNGLGLVVHIEPCEFWYVSAGIADAQADAREMGFNTAFDREDYFFSIFETGVVSELKSAAGPLLGAYRVGFWYDPQPKARVSGVGSERDDLGLYVSADQMIYRESGDNDQGLGLFARFGWADNDLNAVKSFWSVGAQYQGLVAGRDDDVLGFGVAQGRLSRDGGGLTDSHETVMELYYNAQVAPWLSVSPHLQIIRNPGGAGTDDAVVAGVRLQMAF